MSYEPMTESQDNSWRDLPSWVKLVVIEVSLWVRNATDDWAIIKREIVQYSPNSERDKFSRLACGQEEENEFDRKVMAFWRKITGVWPKTR